MTSATRLTHPGSADAALLDMRFNLALIEDFVGGFTFEIFEREWKTRYATLHAFEIVCAASGRLPADLQGRHPGISWKEMRDVCNEVRHQQEPAAAARLWKMAVEDMPPLLTVVEAELAAVDSDRDRSGNSNS